MTKAQTKPQFAVGSRVFTHYDMKWGTVVEVSRTERDRYYRSSGKPEDRMDDTTWYEVKYDKGGGNLLDDAHGNWEMARIIPPAIAKRYGYGDDPAAALQERFTVMVNGIDLRSALVHALIEECGHGNSVGREDPSNFADAFMERFGKESMWGHWDQGRDDWTPDYTEYAKTAGLLRH